MIPCNLGKFEGYKRRAKRRLLLTRSNLRQSGLVGQGIANELKSHQFKPHYALGQAWGSKLDKRFHVTFRSSIVKTLTKIG